MDGPGLVDGLHRIEDRVRGLIGAAPWRRWRAARKVARTAARVFFVMQSSSARWPVQSTHLAGSAESSRQSAIGLRIPVKNGVSTLV